MKLFLTYLLLISPTVGAVACVVGVPALFFYICSLIGTGGRLLPGWVGLMGAGLIALFALCPDEQSARLLLEALK